MLSGLREVAAYDEPINSISCDSWASDYLLFGSDGALITPTYHSGDPRTEDGKRQLFSKIPWELLYEETGVQRMPTLFQLGAENGKRLKRASQLMPIADGFNYLLAGVPRVEISSASATQLYSPLTRQWSRRLMDAVNLPSDLLPPVVNAGTDLGELRPEIADATGLQETRVVASCSNELAAALMGLPLVANERWAFLKSGESVVMGMELAEPIINDVSRELNFTNEIGFGGSVRFSRQMVGLSILEECRRFWKGTERELDSDVLTHLAVCATPFESLINPADPRFATPGDMPLKIQAFCKETGQTVPRKPGPMVRCILESLALQYRRTLRELEYVTGEQVDRLFVFGGSGNDLLHHFTANALEVPVVLAPANAAGIGNIVVQALALGHVESVEQARELVRDSFKTQTIVPHAAVWNSAYERFAELMAV
jgi:rhamnulokinase